MLAEIQWFYQEIKKTEKDYNCRKSFFPNKKNWEERNEIDATARREEEDIGTPNKKAIK